MDQVIMSHGRRSAFALFLALAGCGRDVLISGVRGAAPDAGAPVGGTAGHATGAVRSPVCDESLFAHEGLPGVQLAEQLSPYVVGNWTRPTVTGDFNRDGVPDIALPNYDLASISVVLGNGDGTFRPRTDYATGANPAGIAAQDLNGDGAPDLVVVNNGSGSATVLLGKGDGTFARRADYPTLGATPAVVAIGEWTSDGKPDFIAGDTLFAGKGDGTFARGVTYGYVPDALATADLDGDGKLDLILIQIGAAYALVARGDGTFRRKSTWQLGEYGAQPTLADLNGDRVPDLIILGLCPNRINSAFYLMMGAGDGTFKVTQMSSGQPCGLPIGVGDVNGDGKTDLQFGLQETWFGNGDGTFVPFAANSANSSDAFVSLNDWNGDGRPDVAVLDANTMLETLPGDGTGTFGRLPSVPLANTPSYPIADLLADIDRDGRLDLVLLSSSGLEAFPGKGDGTFAAPRAIALSGVDFQAEQLRAADVNGDGAPDLILFAGSGYVAPVAVTLNLAHDFGFGPPLSSASVGTFGAMSDMNGDGLADLILMTRDASGQQNFLTTLFLTSDGTFGPPIQTTLPVLAGPTVFGDLDKDGRTDVVMSSAFDQGPPTMWRLKGNPDGTFTQQDGAIALPQPPEAGPIAVGDVNGDGEPDVVLSDSLGAISVYLGTGGGALGAVPVTSAGSASWSGWTDAALFDVNADGALDLVSSGGGVQLGRGDGTFACGQVVNADFYGAVAFGDVNNDGRPDAVTVGGIDQTSSNLTVLLAR